MRLSFLFKVAQISHRTEPRFNRYMFNGSIERAVVRAPATVKKVADHSKIAVLLITSISYFLHYRIFCDKNQLYRTRILRYYFNRLYITPNQVNPIINRDCIITDNTNNRIIYSPIMPIMFYQIPPNIVLQLSVPNPN